MERRHILVNSYCYIFGKTRCFVEFHFETYQPRLAEYINKGAQCIAVDTQSLSHYSGFTYIQLPAQLHRTLALVRNEQAQSVWKIIKKKRSRNERGENDIKGGSEGEMTLRVGQRGK